MVTLIVAIFLSYLLGSFPTSYILGRLITGIDIRRYGSGNVGATNLLRTVGKLPALLALSLDILKGVIAVTYLSNFSYLYGAKIDYESIRILLGLAVICGHIWTVFLKFKGGKGVATSAGVILVLAPNIFGILALIWLISAISTRYVSLSSLVVSISFPILAAIAGKSLPFVIFAITLCIISTYKHKSNIIRLINNDEPKIGQKVNIS